MSEPTAAAPDPTISGGTIPDAPAPLPLDVAAADQAPPGDAPKGRRARRELSAAELAARRANGAKGGRPPKAVVNSTQRARRVSAFYGQVGGMLALFGGLLSPRASAVGAAMADQADQLGAAWAEWADNSPAVAKMIDSLTTGGAAGAVLLAHGPIIAAAMAPPIDPATDPAGAGVATILSSIFAQSPAPDATPAA